VAVVLTVEMLGDSTSLLSYGAPITPAFPLDRPCRGAHPAADLRGLERRPGRRRGGQRPVLEPSAISLFVPTSMNRRRRRSRVSPGGEHPGDDVAAAVSSKRRENKRGIERGLLEAQDRFGTAGRMITWRPTPAIAAFGPV